MICLINQAGFYSGLNPEISMVVATNKGGVRVEGLMLVSANKGTLTSAPVYSIPKQGGPLIFGNPINPQTLNPKNLKQ